MTHKFDFEVSLHSWLFLAHGAPPPPFSNSQNPAKFQALAALPPVAALNSMYLKFGISIKILILCKYTCHFSE